MRMTRIAATLVATIASFALVLTTAPANAEQEVTAQAGFGTFNAELNDQGNLIARGKANTWRRKIVLLQRQRANGGSWVTFEKVRTTSTGAFRYTVRPGSDIPCAGDTRYKLRAKKKGRPQAKVDDDVWFC